MDNINRFKKDFKQDVLIQVVVALRHGRTTQENSSYLARLILEIFQEQEAREVFKKINKLSETHPQIVDIFIKRASEYEARHKEENLNQIRVYLKPATAKVPAGEGGVN